MKSIKSLKNKHKGEDIWVVGSGASMNYVHPSFFDNKINVGINLVDIKYKCDYLVHKHKECIQERIDRGENIVCSEHDCGSLDKEKNIFTGEYYMFKHLHNETAVIDLSPLDSEDMLVVSYTTLTSGIHLAYYMGAKNIILCGHDCGDVGGQDHFRHYPTNPDNDYRARFFKAIEEQTIKLAKALRHRGVSVCSLNPFINLALEGRVYQKLEVLHG